MSPPSAWYDQQGARMTADPSISTFRTAFVPCASGSVFGDEPGWVYPSTVTGSVVFGSQVVSTIVWTPAPGIAKAIVSAPGVALESRIAWRRDPAPESVVVVTVKVAAESDAAAAKKSTAACRTRRTTVRDVGRKNAFRSTPFGSRRISMISSHRASLPVGKEAPALLQSKGLRDEDRHLSARVVGERA